MSAIPPSSGPIPLEYAPLPPRWRKHVRRILLGLILVAGAFCAWRWGPYAWHQSQLLYWQRQCLNFSASPDTVVYEEDPTASALLRQRSDYSLYVLKWAQGLIRNSTTMYDAAFCPQCWRNLRTFFPVDYRVNAGAIIFLHERISCAGHRRLVWVNYRPSMGTFSRGFDSALNYDGDAIPPATWTKPAIFERWSYGEIVNINFEEHPPLVRVYAGQPDPTDPAHFTIRYQMWGQEDTLDGRLLDDDQITLTPRHRPQEPRR